MSTRSILNKTSRKKKDTMLCVTNTTPTVPSGSSTYNPAPAVLNAGGTYMFPWICTWRDNGGAGTIYDDAVRSSTTCYMRGLKEKINLVSNDGTQWLWRRICFTYKGGDFYGKTATGYALALTSSTNGFQRVVNDINNAGSSGQPLRTEFLNVMFRGGNTIDWNNVFTAPLNTTRVSVRYDKVTSLSSGNAAGKNMIFNRWHGMNKNLVYDDDEDGQETNPGAASVGGKPGMGDYYVIDFFQSGPAASSGSQLAFAPEATLYWHEK
jgi:hypothetical protein